MTFNIFRSSGANAVVFTGALLGLLVFFFAVVRYGTEGRELARVQWTSEIERESQAFCRKFGIAPESSRFAECAADLSEIRRLHEERLAKEGAGIL